jgi:ribosomal-protein-alanine N-acetyltransferase
MITLETERLLIRNFSVDDGELLHRIIVQYQTSPMAAYDHPWPTSADEIRGVAAWFAGGDAFLAVCLKESGRLIGLVSLNPEPGEEGLDYSLGYIFDATYHGRGYATEACRAALDHAFGRAGARRVVTGTAAAKRASCRLLERIGFQRTGECQRSFTVDAAGQPVTFLGYTYVLTGEAWVAGVAGTAAH